jgi:hypothetical protein
MHVTSLNNSKTPTSYALTAADTAAVSRVNARSSLSSCSSQTTYASTNPAAANAVAKPGLDSESSCEGRCTQHIRGLLLPLLMLPLLLMMVHGRQQHHECKPVHA